MQNQPVSGCLIFQSTLPRRERRRTDAAAPVLTGFQSTLPRRERPPGLCARSGCSVYFNPRSREGSDRCYDRGTSSAILISIHAPAKGATQAAEGNARQMGISIHAPAKGATFVSSKAPYEPHFNPRSREGSDRGDPLVKPEPTISIHAPAKGATRAADSIHLE